MILYDMLAKRIHVDQPKPEREVINIVNEAVKEQQVQAQPKQEDVGVKSAKIGLGAAVGVSIGFIVVPIVLFIGFIVFLIFIGAMAGGAP